MLFTVLLFLISLAIDENLSLCFSKLMSLIGAAAPNDFCVNNLVHTLTDHYLTTWYDERFRDGKRGFPVPRTKHLVVKQLPKALAPGWVYISWPEHSRAGLQEVGFYFELGWD